MKNAIIIHGTGGSPSGNWFPWLASELEKNGYSTHIPEFPTPEHQSLQSWLDIFEQYTHYLDKDAIVIGHSLGPAFLLRVLEKIPHPIAAAFFVSGFITDLNNPEFDEPNKTFLTDPFDWARIQQHCRKFVVINSDNDPYVPIEKGQFLAEQLNTNLITIKGGGHLNAEFGYTSFPFLLNYILLENEK